MNCSEQQPERQYEESSTAQPDLFCAHIAPSQEPDLGNNHAYANATEMNDPKVNDPEPELLSKNNDIVYGEIVKSQDPVSGNDNLEDNDTVMYSELLSREQC